MARREITVTDGNGVDYHADTFDADPGVDGHVYAWVYVDKPSGFGFDVGTVVGVKVKELGDSSGKYGAG
jgi:hypothetical protein